MTIRLPAFLIALVLLSGQAAFGQGVPDLDAAAVQIHRSKCRDGLDSLTAIASGHDLEGQRASYLMGWCLSRGGRHQEAAVAFQQAADHPTLGMLARIEEGLARNRAGASLDAATIVQDVITRTSGKLRGRALAALGQVELDRRNPSAAADALRAAVALRPSDPSAWLLAGDAEAALGRTSVARRALSLAAWAFPGNTSQSSARLSFAKLQSRSGVASEAPPAPRARRGRRLASRGAPGSETDALLRVVAARSSGRAAAGAWYRLGEIWMRDDLPAAYVAFKRATVLGWDSVKAYERTTLIARQLGLEAEEREANDALARTGPNVWAARRQVAAGLRAEKAGQSAAAATFYQRAIALNPRSYEATEAAWRLGWIALRQGRAGEAEARYREAARSAPMRGESTRARAWYWVAKAMEARGAPDANAMLRTVAEEFPMTFYGQRARTRLGLQAPSLAAAPQPAVPRESPGPIHEELARLGLDTDAAVAAEDAMGERQDVGLVRFLAETYARLGAYPRSVAMAEEALINGVRDEAMWRLAYPRAYWTAVVAAADAAKIDPLLLLALVREESRYDPNAISSARAVGLAQLLPSTARVMLRNRSLSAQALTEPEINLRLGARYLSGQLERFGGDVRLALAAYNAGPGSARRWVGMDADTDHFVERISITETRGYVRRVMGSYAV
jgi:soluble lytic murein transglycosylase-like protein